MLGVVKLVPFPKLAPPAEAAYQLIVPVDAVAPKLTVPVPHLDAGVVPVIVGIVFTVIVKVVVVAHKPAVGVKVYVVVARLFNPGDQVPVTALFEVVGKAESTSP